MYSAWIAFGGASLLIALSACQPEMRSVQSSADAVSTEVGMARELHDAARQRIWRLTQTGLALGRIRNDPENLSDERIESLRVAPDAGSRFTRAAIAAADVKDPPVVVAAASGGIEAQRPERVNPCVQLHAHQFARGTLECCV